MSGKRFCAVALAVGLACCCFGCGKTPEPLTPTVTKPAEGVGEPLYVVEKTDGVQQGGVTGEIVDDWDKELPEIDTTVQYDYSRTAFSVAHGAFSANVGTGVYPDYTSTARDSLIARLDDTKPFPYGTIEFDIRTNTTADSGVIFGVTTPLPSFWEGNGISYYFFFFNHQGLAYLGKCDNGKWWIHKQVAYPYNATDTYRMKVVYEGSKICCYVNGELVIGYRDRHGLSGTGFGFRTNEIGVSFSNISVTSELCYEEGV